MHKKEKDETENFINELFLRAFTLKDKING
jgi:hypothetical protein